MSQIKSLFLFSALCACAIASILLSGCSSTAPPNAFEQRFFDITTNSRLSVVTVTNVVPVVENRIEVQTVTVTNTVGVQVPIYVTNTITQTNFQTQVASVTNDVPTYTLTTNANAKATAGIAGTLANLGLPGVGSLVTMGILGIGAAWGGVRTRQYAGKNDALTQTAGVLTQNLATFQEVLSKTPQGADLAKTAADFIRAHQSQAGVAGQVLQLATDNVDNAQAKLLAAQIQAIAGSLGAKP